MPKIYAGYIETMLSGIQGIAVAFITCGTLSAVKNHFTSVLVIFVTRPSYTLLALLLNLSPCCMRCSALSGV